MLNYYRKNDLVKKVWPAFLCFDPYVEAVKKLDFNRYVTFSLRHSIIN